MLKKFLVCISFFLGVSSALAQELPRYNIQATIDTNLKTIVAHQSVIFTNTTNTPLQEVYFHVYANRQYTQEEASFMLRYTSYFKITPPVNFAKNKFEISRLEIDSQAAEYVFEGTDKTLLKISLKEPLAPGASVTITMDFHLTVPHTFGRFGWYEDIMALSRWYPILSVLEPNGWDQSPFYPFHRPFFSESSYYTVDITIPTINTVIHSGDWVSEIIQGQDKKIHIETSKPIREFSLAISPSYHLYQQEKDGITFNAYYLSGNLERSKLAIKDAQDLMAFYTKRFGGYPYKSFSIAPVHLAYGGEQMSNMIFIDTRVFELSKFLGRYFDFLIAHETGHQWFYNVIGVNNFSQMWLEEGINSYFIMEYLSDKYGPDAAVVELPRWIKFFVPEFSFKRVQDLRYKMASRLGFERPVISKLSSFHEPSSIFTFTYGKGSKVLQMLKSTVGDEAFERIFKKIFEQYSFKNLDIKDFERIAQEESKKDLTVFFEQWLYSTKTLDAKVDKVEGSAVYVSRQGGISMPVNVDIYHPDGTHEAQVWDGVHKRDILSAQSDKPISSVELDAQKNLLDIDRVNNIYPRRINTKLVPLYYGLYDIPVFLPDDGYSWVSGINIGDGLGFKSVFQKPYDYNIYAQTGYDISEKKQTTREGFEIKNVLHSQTAFGFEAMQRVDYDSGEDDLSSQKVYIRRELWPAAYSLTGVNDHVTLYAIRNRTPDSSLLPREKVQNTSYFKHDEAILGTMLHLDRAGPHPDARQGYVTDLMIENSGHWVGATQTFTRASIDHSFYHAVVAESKMAYRIKYGWGSSDDKNLFELGGMDGLRGFDRKSVRGANALLGSAEYRFPLVDSLHISSYDHLLILDKISGAVFFDAGEAWFDNFDDGKFRKDLGAGLRFHLSLGSFLENMIVRLDIAKAIDDPKEGAHAWVGINQAF